MKSRLNRLLLTSNWENEPSEDDMVKVEPDVVPEPNEETGETDALWESLDVIKDSVNAKVKSSEQAVKREIAVSDTTIKKRKKRKVKVT